ncbi:MAG: hypothetical protein MSC30_16200 [Gaiellaceae bacterium MAG52_C11]|nr:hypothetical protein [Candidatus Gaiellasilicea maunaloa]
MKAAGARGEVWIVGLWVLLSTGGFFYAATQEGYWDTIAPLASLIWFGVVAAVVLRRRWAWILALAFELSVLVSWPFDPGPWPFLLLRFLAVALLVSPQMRAHLAGRNRRRAQGSSFGSW